MGEGPPVTPSPVGVALMVSTGERVGTSGPVGESADRASRQGRSEEAGMVRDGLTPATSTAGNQ